MKIVDDYGGRTGLKSRVRRLEKKSRRHKREIRHLTAHDRAQDRRNLKHARAARRAERL